MVIQAIITRDPVILKCFLMILPCTNRKDVVIYMYAGSCGSIRTHGNKNKRSRRTKDGIADHGLHCLFCRCKAGCTGTGTIKRKGTLPGGKREDAGGPAEDQGKGCGGYHWQIREIVAAELKARGEEIARSYDAEIGKTEDQLKKVKAKREKARNQGVKGRIAEDTQSLSKENEELKGRIRTLFRANHVPGYCAGGLYYSLYFTRGLKEMGILLLALLIFFLAVPCGIYFAVPERKTWYLILIYLADILIFGGVYVKIGNSTKMKHMDALREGRSIRNRIQANKKQMKAIARTIRRDKNDAVYNLEKFDDEIAQLDQDLLQTNKKKKEALAAFDTVTKTILSDEIMESNKPEIDRLQGELAKAVEELKAVRTELKEKTLYTAENFEAYTGKEFMTMERLEALEGFIRAGEARNISEAVTVFKSRDRQGTPQ